MENSTRIDDNNVYCILGVLVTFSIFLTILLLFNVVIATCSVLFLLYGSKNGVGGLVCTSMILFKILLIIVIMM